MFCFISWISEFRENPGITNNCYTGIYDYYWFDLDRIEFPFLVLLASGGHCLLTVAQDVDRFLILGDCLDSAPGDCLEKVGR